MKYILTAAALAFCIVSKAQFRNDDVLYKTIDPSQLCGALQNSPGYLLLDVRSAGEHADTSSYGLNYGRFNNATNIPVGELAKRIHELDVYKNKPVFVYCSHSQRSRRASKILADSGFTNVNNINGGITAFHYRDIIENNACLRELYQTGNKYKLLSPPAFCRKITAGKGDIFILDVRSDSAFRHISDNEKEQAMGIFSGSVNIPLAQVENKISQLPADKEIIITDIYGDDAGKAASMLASHGYKKLFVLIEGVDRWAAMDNKQTSCDHQLYQSFVSYRLLPVFTFADWMKTKKKCLVVDIRSDSEYQNIHKDVYRNIGHIKGAIHIPLSSLDKKYTVLDKETEIVLYGFGGDPPAFNAAALLTKKGFKKINVLVDGIFNIRWTAGNINGYRWLQELVEDVPEKNR